MDGQVAYEAALADYFPRLLGVRWRCLPDPTFEDVHLRYL